MKRMIVFAVVILSVSLFAGSAIAATITGATSIGLTPFTPTSNVTVKVASNANGSQYCAETAHAQGTFQYGTCGGTGTTQDPSKIFRLQCTANPCGTAAPTDPSSSALSAGAWESF